MVRLILLTSLFASSLSQGGILNWCTLIFDRAGKQGENPPLATKKPESWEELEIENSYQTLTHDKTVGSITINRGEKTIHKHVKFTPNTGSLGITPTYRIHLRVRPEEAFEIFSAICQSADRYFPGGLTPRVGASGEGTFQAGPIDAILDLHLPDTVEAALPKTEGSEILTIYFHFGEDASAEQLLRALAANGLTVWSPMK